LKRCLACNAVFEADGWRCPACGAAPVERDGFPAFAPALAEADDGFDASLFPQLYALETRHFWFRARNALIVWALRRYFPRARRLLEIGCGTGCVLAGLREARPDLQLAASEISTAGLSFARTRVPGAELMQMDARVIPYREHFDVIGAFDVIEHIEDDRAVLAEMHRATTPGGGILLTVPQHPWLWSPADERAHHRRRYTARELAGKLAEAGFRLVRMTSFVTLLLPLMTLSRWLARRRAEHFDPLAELRIGGAANAGLSGVLAVERAAVRAGINWPAGGSLLAVAAKA
jgi:SAM-dependent methyltransferase